MTADRYEDIQTDGGIIDSEKGAGSIKLFQTIYKLGPNCYPYLNIGDKVLINPTRYSHPEHSLREGSVFQKNKDEVQMVTEFPVITIDDKEYLYIFDNDIDMLVDSWEETPDIIEQ